MIMSWLFYHCATIGRQLFLTFLFVFVIFSILVLVAACFEPLNLWSWVDCLTTVLPLLANFFLTFLFVFVIFSIMALVAACFEPLKLNILPLCYHHTGQLLFKWKFSRYFITHFAGGVWLRTLKLMIMSWLFYHCATTPRPLLFNFFVCFCYFLNPQCLLRLALNP